MVFLLLWSFTTLLSPPHGDIHERIEALTAQIKAYPDSTELYVARGELYLLHGDQKEAREDFNFCLKKERKTDRVFLGLSKTLFAENLPDSSLYFVDLALALNGTNPACLEWKGFVLRSMNSYCLSADTYEYLLSITVNPSPSLFIEAAESRMECKELFSEEMAVSVIQSGLYRLGRLHVLETALVDVYLHYNRVTEALQFQTEMIDQWQMKAVPYYKRAKTYISIKNYAAAKNDLNAALKILDQLPYYKTNTSAMKSLRVDIISLLNETTN